MHQIRQLLPIVSILFAGCATAPNTRVAAGLPGTQIRQRLQEVLEAAEKKDFQRLDSYHLYGPKFTKFTTEAPARLDAEAARKGEHDGLGAATGLTMKVHDLKIDLFGEVAIATFILKYSSQTDTGLVEKQARSTLVFVHDHGDWKIAHEHLSR